MENKELQIIYKNNLLIKSSYNLNLVENRFYLTILFNMQKSEKGNYICSISKNDFLNLIKNSTQKRKKEIENILTNISDRYIEILEYKENNKTAEYKFHIINGFKYVEDTDSYTIELSTVLYDLIISYMDGGYTPLNLGILLGLNNYYAQRFYEMMRLWSGTKTKINYTIDYLRECLQLENKYPNFFDFNKRVIEPSIKALNDSECFNISYKERKVGRKVVSIDFIVEDLETRTYFQEESEICNDKFAITKLSDIEKEEAIKDNRTYSNVKEEPFMIKSDEIYENNFSYNTLDLESITKQVKKIFIKDFKNVNFYIERNSECFDYAVGFATEKDDVEFVGMKQYSYFKKTLTILLEKAEKNEVDDFLNNLDNKMFW